MSRWVLAIDFGTSTTSAAVGLPDGRVEVVELGGAARMPSVVLASESGELVVGIAAEAQLSLAPERAERTPKRRLGDEVMLLGSRALRPVEAVAAILGAVAAEAIRRQGGTQPAEVRLTHPARWGSLRRAVLAEAAALAGLPEPVFVPEPVAAAVHFADERIVPGAFVVVYDLGGGTFDTAVLRRSAEGFDVVGLPGGDERLGGELFDEKLFALVGERLAASNPEGWEALRFSTERSWRKAGHDLRLEVRRAKESLSANADYTIYVGAPVDATVVVTRDELERLIAADVGATVDELEATVTRAGLALKDLAAVNLAGGSSRIPLVTRLVAERFGQVPQTWGDPKAAVALGALKATNLTSVSTAASGDPSSGSGRRAAAVVAPLPERIGDYEVVAELGRGGMGVVYLAQQASLGRPVAVKTIPMLDPGLTDRLQREASVLAELQHPNIATVIDVGTDDRGTFVVMPFFAGGTAAHLLHRDGRVAPGEVVAILAPVADALAATHARGFVHRDVKPSNILLSERGDPYLADFGLALPMLDSSRLSHGRSVVGTVQYAAPETLADETPGPAADVYALAVTGYQLLTGVLPFPGSNVLAVLDAIRGARPVPVVERCPACPAPLAALIHSALDPDPTKRPVDLHAWANQLRATVTPERPTPAPPATWLTAAAHLRDATVAEAPTAADVAVEDLLPPPEPTTSAPARRARDRQRILVLAAIALLVVLVAAGAFALGGGDDPGGDAAGDDTESTEGTNATASTTSTASTTTTSSTQPGSGGLVVPEVVGMHVDEAREIFLSMGLDDLEVVNETDPSKPTGTVLGVLPSPGEPITPDERILIVVNS